MTSVTNLWPEPSIETGEDWVAVSGSDAPAPSSTRAYVGTDSLYCRRGAGGSVTYGADNGFQAYITAGGGAAGTYRLSLRIWVPSSVTGGTQGIRISGAGTTLQDLSTATRNDWAEITTTFAWDGVGALNLSALGNSADAECYIDAIILTAGADYVSYFDGDTAQDARYRYAWVGTAHASRSTRYDLAATVKVEVAFNAGYRTPAASRTWTDVSAYVELAQNIGIGYGRQDEFSTADANILNLVFDNTDGRFTWGNASSPYYPNVLKGRPVRVTVTAPFTSTRYTGFIDGWPVSWPGESEAYAAVNLSAASRMARLGLAQKLLSVIETEILLDAPVAYYTLGEAEGATQANDSSGSQAPPLRPEIYATFATQSPPVFGTATGPGTDGLTALQFAVPAASGSSSQHMRAHLDPSIAVAVIELFFTATFGGDGAANLFVSGIDGNPNIHTSDVGTLTANGTGWSITSADSVIDGNVHHVCLRQNGGTIELYLDGDLAGTDAGTIDPVVGTYSVGPMFSHGGDVTVGLAHVALYDHDLDPARIAEHADAGLTGFRGDTVDERLERYAAWAHIPTDEISVTASDIEVDHIPTDGQGPLDLIRQLETTEAGVLHDGRDGKLTLRNRDARYGATVAVTLDASAQEVGVDFAPTVDGFGLYNMGAGQNLDGTVTASYNDEDSREEYGDHTYSVETASTDEGEPLQLAAAVVNANAEPRPRVPVVTVDLTPLDAATMQAVAGLDIGSLIELTNLPDQTPGGTTQQFFVEGYSETFGVGEWRITFNLSPVWPLDSLLVWDVGTWDDGFLWAL